MTKTLTSTLDKLNAIAGTPEIPALIDFIDRKGVYRGGSLQGSTTPPVFWRISKNAFFQNADVENTAHVDCFTQGGKHILAGSSSGFEVYLLDSRGIVIEKLNHTFSSPEEFELQKHQFLCPNHCSST